MAKLELALSGEGLLYPDRAAILLPAENWTGQLRLSVYRGRLSRQGGQAVTQSGICPKCGTEAIPLGRVEGVAVEKAGLVPG